MHIVEIDVSRKGVPRDQIINARLIIACSQEMTSQEALKRFRRATSQWLANTQDGKAAWAESVHDFNYGDFSMGDVEKDDDFIQFMMANGLLGAHVEQIVTEDCGETWDSVIKPEGL